MIERRVYNYLDEVAIGLQGPREMLDLCQKNIDEEPITSASYGDVKIIKGSPVQIVRDSSFPYAWIKETSTNLGTKWDYHRYGSVTRSYTELGSNIYLTTYHISDDCDGILKCFLKLYLSSECSKNKSNIHGTSLAVGKKGILIAGPCWSGKTTTSFRIIDQFNGALISEGTSFVSGDNHILSAFYRPQPIYARLSLISKLPKLSPLLNSDEWDVEQYFDFDSLKRIIQAKRFDLDAGIRVTRHKLSQIMETKLRRDTTIDTVIFTRYGLDNTPKIEKLSNEQIVYNLRANEFKQTINFGKLENQKEEMPPLNSKIDSSWTERVKGVLLTFNRYENLSHGVLEDLLE